MDVAIRNMPGVLGAVGGPPGAAVALAYAPVDAFGGGINPMSNATGFSAYFSVKSRVRGSQARRCPRAL